MNNFKFKAYLSEFKFLETCLLNPRTEKVRESRYCDALHVARLSAELLNSIPTWDSWSGSMVGISKKETVYFVFHDGSVIIDAVRQRGEHGSNEAYSQTYEDAGESFLEAIDRLNAADLMHIVILRTGFTVREHYSEPNYSVVIYKAGKGERLIDFINAAKSAAIEEVRAEANF